MISSLHFRSRVFRQRAALGRSLPRCFCTDKEAARRRREELDELTLGGFAEADGYGHAPSPPVANWSADMIRRRRLQAIDRWVWSRAEAAMTAVVAQKDLVSTLGFQVEVGASTISAAGEGVFVKAADKEFVTAGTLLAMYSGTVFLPHEVRWLGGYGGLFERVADSKTTHIVGRSDGIRIDGLWSSMTVPAAEWDVDDATLTKMVSNLGLPVDSPGHRAARRDLDQFRAALGSASRRDGLHQDAPGLRNLLRRINPLAVGEMVNHPPQGTAANVLFWPVDLDLTGEDARARRATTPTAFGLRPEGSEETMLAPCSHTVALFAARDLHVGEELFWDYGFEILDDDAIPSWFVPAVPRVGVE